MEIRNTEENISDSKVAAEEDWRSSAKYNY